MENFEYANPTTLKEALSLLTAGAEVLAGGTDLLSLLKDDVHQPKRLVNIKNIKTLGGIAGTLEMLANAPPDDSDGSTPPPSPPRP